MTVDVQAAPDLASKRDRDIDRAERGIGIRDRRFMKALRRLRLLRSFEIQEIAQSSDEKPVTREILESLGHVLRLRYWVLGRPPSEDEWAKVDRLTSDLFSRLSEPLRKKFLRSQISSLVAYLPVFLITIACISLVLTVNTLAEARKIIIDQEFSTTPEAINLNDSRAKSRASYESDLENARSRYRIADDAKYSDVQKKSVEQEVTDFLRVAQSRMSERNQQYDREYQQAKIQFVIGKQGSMNISVERLMSTATTPRSSDENTLGRDEPTLGSSGTIILYYITWLITMGCIGAVAFIGMNAISAQDDIAFDISNVRLMVLRVVLGGLFAMVLTIPFGSESFIEFCYFIGTGARDLAASKTDGGNSFARALMLTTPFLLGFSTSLVILILNQAIDGIQAFFGRRLGAVREPDSIALRRPRGVTATSSAPPIIAATSPPPPHS